MSRHIRVLAAIASASFGAAALAPVHSLLADSPDPNIQKTRHDHYHRLGDAFKAVRDGSRAGSPDWDALLRAAQVVHDGSVKQDHLFPAGSGPEAGKTRALAAIWSKPEEFAAAKKKFSDATPGLLAAAQAKDAAKLRAQFAQVGQACKNCHDSFRSPEDHD